MDDFHAGWDAFRDTLKARVWDAKQPLSVADVAQIINTHHFGWYAGPPNDRENARLRQRIAELEKELERARNHNIQLLKRKPQRGCVHDG